jgi:toluene monooxygenase system ferredoxin subunit
VTWRSALAANELWEGDVTPVEVAGRQLMLVRLPGGEIRAYQGRCPHQGAALADGAGAFDGRTLTCAAHGWQFDLATGRGVNPAGCALDRFAVTVRDDQIFIFVEPKDASDR